MSRKIESLSVVGAGTMGHGIAQVAAVAGKQVTLIDVTEEALEKGLAGVRKSLDKLVSKGRIEQEAADAAFGRIQTGTDVAAGVKNADLVVEAVPEKMQLKLELFAIIDEAAPEHAILATNTSSLSVTEIAASTKRAAQVIGLHFFNPVPVMKLLEIVQGLSTSEQTVEAAKAFAEEIAKEAIVVKDWPGFATSRLGIILGCEAIRMLEEGVASPADIDKAMELGYRHPMGPLKLTDLVGLDVRLAIMEHLFAELGEQFRPPALLRQMVRAGKLGRKSGEGFYKY